MGEIADMMIEGDMCSQCGHIFADEGPGYPRLCAPCGRESRPAKTRESNYDIALGRKILNRLALAAADGGALWDSAPSQHARLERLGLVARQEDCAVITKAGRSALSRTEGAQS